MDQRVGADRSGWLPNPKSLLQGFTIHYMMGANGMKIHML